MKKMIKRINIALACLTTALVGTGLAMVNASADETEASASNFCVYGAQVHYMTAEQSEKDENGIRFLIAVDYELFSDLVADNATIAALAVAEDVVTSDKAELTLDTEVSGNYQVETVEFSYNDFQDGVIADYKVAYLTLENFKVSQYNRVHMVNAYYQIPESDEVYAGTKRTTMAAIAKEAASKITGNTEKELAKKAKLESYVKEYGVTFVVGGQEQPAFGVKYGEAIATGDIPTFGNDVIFGGWFKDANFEEEFDITSPIVGTTKIYAKTQTIADATGGVFKSMTSDYTIESGDPLKLVQSLGKNEKGLAKFNLQPTDDYYISLKVTMDDKLKVTSVAGGKDNRFGFAFIDEAQNMNYRFFIRGTQFAAVYQPLSEHMYGGEDSTTKYTYIYGKQNATSSRKTPYVELSNVNSINENLEMDIAFQKVGNQISFYVGGYLIVTQTVADGFNGIPSLLNYTNDVNGQGYNTPAYSNIVVKKAQTNTIASFTEDYVGSMASGSLVLTQTLQQSKNGLAYFKGVKAGDDFTISMKVTLSGSPATLAQPANAGADMRVGLALLDTATGVNYSYMFRGTKCALIERQAADSLYEARKGSSYEKSTGNVTYIVGKTNSTTYNNDPDYKETNDAPVQLQNTGAINGSSTINLKYEKVGTSMKVYINDELAKEYTIGAEFTGVPVLLSYNLDTKTDRVHKFSNIVVTVTNNA